MNEQLPKGWTRDSPWRQGSVFSSHAVEAFGMGSPIAETVTVVMVISHDCDLVIDNLDVEPNVEVIVGRVVGGVDGNFSWGKAPRTLHVPIDREGSLVTVELVATNKRLVPKTALAYFEPDPTLRLDAQGRSVLRGWLSARYNRTAFPDTFVERMKVTKLDQRLAKILEPYGDLISFVYFDIDEGRTLERPENEPYDLSIVLVYPPGDDPDNAADGADAVVEAVEKVCEQRLKEKTHIVLKKCISISEDDISISQARGLMHWRLEHMTLRADEEQLGQISV